LGAPVPQLTKNYEIHDVDYSLICNEKEIDAKGRLADVGISPASMSQSKGSAAAMTIPNCKADAAIVSLLCLLPPKNHRALSGRMMTQIRGIFH
jgi:hypothetical protein